MSYLNVDNMSTSGDTAVGSNRGYDLKPTNGVNNNHHNNLNINGTGTSKSSHHQTPIPATHQEEPLPSALPFVDDADYLTSQKRKYIVPITKTGVRGALEELDRQCRENGFDPLIPALKPGKYLGTQLNPGKLGLMNNGGSPEIVTSAGCYWLGPTPRMFRTRKWVGSCDASATHIEHLGLLIVQVSQNQAAVVVNPENKAFVVKNGGFAAIAVEGAYRVLKIIDQTHLTTVHRDPNTQVLLGYSEEVTMKGDGGSNYVAATFLDIPASNVAILQRGDELFSLGPGQHHVTVSNVKVRAFLTKGENQIEMQCRDCYLKDQVPVSLRIYFKWELRQPMLLARHGYNTPFDALKDKLQSILTATCSHLDYSSMVKQRTLTAEGSVKDPADDDLGSAFVDSLRTQAMDELHVAALDYGIVVKDLAIMDRRFKGEVAATMDSLVTRALQAQVEAANVERESSNRKKKQLGDYEVAEVKAQEDRLRADTKRYATVQQAEGNATSTKIEAEAQAESTRIAAKAAADALRLKGDADASVQNQHAQIMARARIEVQRAGAFGSNTVFVPTEGLGSVGGMANMMGKAWGDGQKA